jgi:hypothetical protein
MLTEAPNHAQGCVKTRDEKFGNDPFCDMTNFDENGRRIQWSKNEFLHRLALQRTLPVRFRLRPATAGRADCNPRLPRAGSLNRLNAV